MMLAAPTGPSPAEAENPDDAFDSITGEADRPIAAYDSDHGSCGLGPHPRAKLDDLTPAQPDGGEDSLKRLGA